MDGDSIGIYPGEQLYLYSNNGTGMVRTPISYGFGLPLSLTLENQRIYAQVNYSNVNQTSEPTRMQFSNGGDLFGIESSVRYCNPVEPLLCYSTNKVQWIRVRTPPPQNIFPLVLEGSLFMAANQTTANTTSTTSSTAPSSSTTLETTSMPTTVYTSTILQMPIPSTSTISSSSTTTSTSTLSSSTSLETTTANTSTTSMTTASSTTSLNYTATSTVQTSTIPANTTNATQSQNATDPNSIIRPTRQRLIAL